MKQTLVWLVTVVAVSTCVRAPLPKLAVPVITRIPPGCEANFSGHWGHLDDATYRYRARDDGGTLVLTAYRLFASLDAGAPFALTVLQRGSQGFAGETQATVFHPLGAECQARFFTEVVACEGTLTLRSAQATALSQTCEMPAHPQPVPLLVHRLGRIDAGAL